MVLWEEYCRLLCFIQLLYEYPANLCPIRMTWCQEYQQRTCCLPFWRPWPSQPSATLVLDMTPLSLLPLVSVSLPPSQSYTVPLTTGQSDHCLCLSVNHYFSMPCTTHKEKWLMWITCSTLASVAYDGIISWFHDDGCILQEVNLSLFLFQFSTIQSQIPDFLSSLSSWGPEHWYVLRLMSPPHVYIQYGGYTFKHKNPCLVCVPLSKVFSL